MSTKLPTITINDKTNCTKLVAKLVFDHFNTPKDDQHLELLTGTGQGYGTGTICGAVAGGIYAINVILNKQGANEDEIMDVQNEFKKKFKDQFSAYNCSEILDIHFKDSDTDARQPRFCGSLLDKSTNEIIEMVNLAISSMNPIMLRFNSM